MRDAGRAQERSGDTEAERDVGLQDPDPTVTVDPDLVLGQKLFVLVDLGREGVDERLHFLERAVGQVSREAAGADERVVHAQARDELEDVKDLLALAEAVEHHRERAELHAPGRQPHQVRRDPVELHQQHADRLRARRGRRAEQPLDGHAVRGLVEERREVIRARDERDALRPVADLGVLLDPRVKVADHGVRVDDRFPVELEDETQHAVGRGVLRTHVDDQRVLAGARDDRVPVLAADEDLRLTHESLPG